MTIIGPSDRFVPYPVASNLLADRLNSTPEELAAWIFLGPKMGGLASYTNANELIPPSRFHFSLCADDDYLAQLMVCWFDANDIANFEPAERFITGKTLCERWKDLVIRTEPFIRAKIAESRLLDLHPI